MKKLVAIAVAFALLLAMVVSAPVTAQSTKIHVPDDYTTIQAAVDNATAGDTIIVHAGTYEENVEVHRDDLTIRAASGKNRPVVDGDESFAFCIVADGVMVEGFDARGEETGPVIEIRDGAKKVIISNNEVTGGACGISLWDATKSVVIGNEVSGSSDTGISVEATSDNNTIRENKVSNCSLAGIVVAGANSEVIDNEVSDCGNEEGGKGIIVEGASDSLIKGNQVSGGWAGIVVEGGAEWNHIVENKVSGCTKAAILVNESSRNLIKENKISKNGWGIVIDGEESHHNPVKENKVKQSANGGISIRDGAHHNLVKENHVFGSGCDLYERGAGEGNTWEDNKYKTDNFF